MSFSEWQTFKLGQICSKIGSGATPKGGKESYFESGEYSLIRSQNVLDYVFSYDGLAFINEDQASKLNNVTIEEDDVLLNITGDSVARACQVPKNILPARVNQHVAIIRPNKEILDNTFLKYYLLNPSFKALLLTYSSVGATRNAITKGMIEELDVTIPTIEQQKRIAHILSTIDNKIENNLATNQTLEEIARTLFKEWFVNFNYPNADGKMKDSELGEIPEGWEVAELGELIESISDTYKFGNKKEIIFLNTGDILEGHFLHNKYSEISQLPGQAKKSIKLNDILFSEIRPANKRFAFVSFNAEDYVVSTKLMVLRSKEINPLFFYFYLTRDETLKHLQNVAESRSGTFPQITFSQLKEIKIPMPKRDIFNKFIQILESNYIKIQDNIEENKTLKGLRDSLLPKIILGEIEVNG